MTYFNLAQARAFGEIAACLLPSKNRLSGAVDLAEIGGASVEVRRLLRSVGLLSEVSAAPFYQAEARAFIETMRGFSAFDQIAAMAHAVPLRRRVTAMAAELVGDAPGEGQLKTVSPFDIAENELTLLKALCIVVQSADMSAALTEAGINFLLDQMRGAVGPATDRTFFNAILSGVSAEPSTGNDASSFRADVAAALKRLGLGTNSRPVLVVDPDQAVDLAFMEDALGSQAFPDMSFSGGTISGVPTLVSGAVSADADSSPAARRIAVIDAQGLAIDTGEIVLSPASEATLIIDGEDVNLWQDNLVALKAERFVGASVARAGAVQVISGTNYGTSGETSP